MVPGDIDGNGTLADADFGALLAHIGAAQYVASADLNRDGGLNQQDLDVLVWLYAHPGTDGDCGGYPSCCCIFYGEPGSCVGTANCAGGSGGGSNGTGEGDPGEGEGGGANEGTPGSGGGGPPIRIEYDLDAIRTAAGGGDLPESLEETPGAFVAINFDDDNLDDIPDNAQASGQVVGENDLLPIVVKHVRHNLANPPNPWVSTVSYSSHLRLWRNADRTDEIPSGTTINLYDDTTMFVEGLTPGSAGVYLGYATFNGVGSWLDRVNIWVLPQPYGAKNVPDYSTHSYEETLPNNLVGEYSAQGGVVDDTDPNECRVFWQQGPALGVLEFMPTQDFVIRKEINVVGVQVSTPTNALVATQPTDLGQNVNGGILRKYVSGSLEWAAQISLSGPNGNRGVDRMRIGFVQIASLPSWRGRYATAAIWLRAYMEGSQYCDAGEQLPYYDTNAGAVFFNPDPAHLTKTIASSDGPTCSLPIVHTQAAQVAPGDDIFDEYVQGWVFTIYVVASTSDELGADREYTSRARLDWTFDGTDVSIDQSPPYAWNGSGGAGVFHTPAWESVQDGSEPPILVGPTGTQALQGLQFVLVP